MICHSLNHSVDLVMHHVIYTADDTCLIYVLALRVVTFLMGTIMVSAVNVNANKISYSGMEAINQSGARFFDIFESSFGALIVLIK